MNFSSIKKSESVIFFARIIFPQDKEQKRILMIAFLGFSILSLYLFSIGYDSFFKNACFIGYDPNPNMNKFLELKYLHPFSGNFRHPFIAIILSPLTVIFCLLGTIFSKSIVMFFMMLLFNMITAFIVLVLYKYFVCLIKIDKRTAYLLCALYISFAHVMILVSIPESFHLSALCLLVMIYATTDNILYGTKIPLVSNILLFCFTTGITVSNGAKCVIAQLFQRGDYKSKVRTIIWSGGVCLVLIILSYFCSFLIYHFFLGKPLPLASFISRWLGTQTMNNVFHKFLFEPILFHDYLCETFLEYSEMHYHLLYSLCIVISFYLLLIVSFISSLKYKSARLLLAFFSVDVMIHLVTGFGINESYIYSPHWLFIFIIWIAYFSKRLTNNYLLIALHCTLAFYIVNFLILNGLRMYNILTV